LSFLSDSWKYIDSVLSFPDYISPNKAACAARKAFELDEVTSLLIESILISPNDLHVDDVIGEGIYLLPALSQSVGHDPTQGMISHGKTKQYLDNPGVILLVQ
jgi:hypothetical protein